MGLGDWFSTFDSNLQVKNTASISTRYKRITQRLNTDFGDTTTDSAHSLYVGYDRVLMATSALASQAPVSHSEVAVVERQHGETGADEYRRVDGQLIPGSGEGMGHHDTWSEHTRYVCRSEE
jgi:hypothetical protein